jgi:hypothetical protein
VCLCTPQHIKYRYCGGMAGGNPACVHPETKQKQLESDAREASPPAQVAPHEHPAVVVAHLGFDFSQLAGLSARMTAQSAQFANAGHAAAANHYARLAVVADHVRRLSEELVRGIHGGPPRENPRADASPLPRGGVF